MLLKAMRDERPSQPASTIVPFKPNKFSKTWTFFDGESRAAFREGVPLDEGTWARGRGWALWKSLITLAGDPGEEATARHVVDQIDRSIRWYEAHFPASRPASQ